MKNIEKLKLELGDIEAIKLIRRAKNMFIARMIKTNPHLLNIEIPTDEQIAEILNN